MFWPPGLLATPVAPAAAAMPQGSRGVFIRAERASLPSHASDMLAVRTGQLTAGDSHPIRPAALSAAPIQAQCRQDSALFRAAVWRFDAIRLSVAQTPQSRARPFGDLTRSGSESSRVGRVGGLPQGWAPRSGQTPTAPPFDLPRPDGPPPGCHVPSTSLGPGLDAPVSLLALQPSESCFPWMKRRGWACQSRSLIGFAKRRPWLVSRPTVILRCPQLPGAICPPALLLLRGTADCDGAHDVDRPAMRAGSGSSASRPRGNKGPEHSNEPAGDLLTEASGAEQRRALVRRFAGSASKPSRAAPRDGGKTSDVHFVHSVHSVQPRVTAGTHRPSTSSTSSTPCSPA